MNFYAHCGFSNFISPQPKLTEQFLHIQNHNEFENIDENAPCFDNNEDISDVVVQNVLKKRKLEDEENTEPPVTARETERVKSALICCKSSSCKRVTKIVSLINLKHVPILSTRSILNSLDNRQLQRYLYLLHPKINFI